MKDTKKSKTEKEPTLGEFFDFVKEKFETNEIRFIHLEQRIDTRFASMNDRMDGVDARLNVLQHDVVKIQSRLEDIQDDLTSALQASDNDGAAILNHEHRVSHLEHLGGIKSVPAKHLVGLR